MPLHATPTLRSIRDIGRTSITDAVHRVVSMHKILYDDLDQAGCLLVTEAEGKLQPLTPPSVPTDKQSTERVIVNVNPEMKVYLERFKVGEEATDLVDFWGSAIGFFSQIREKQLLQHRFYKLVPQNGVPCVDELFLDSPFRGKAPGRDN